MFVRETCFICETPLETGRSRALGIGSGCLRELTPAERPVMIAAAQASARPGYVPPPRVMSVQARVNRLLLQQTVQEAVRPQVCRHDQIVGRCGRCARRDVPATCAVDIIEQVRAMSRGDRVAERVKAVRLRVPPGQ